MILSQSVALFICLVSILSANADGQLPHVPGSITTLTNVSEYVYEPKTLTRSHLSSDGPEAFIVVDSSAIVKLSRPDGDVSDKSYNITQLAGHPVINKYVEGEARQSRFNHISAFAQSPDGRKIYIADQDNHCIRLFDRSLNRVSTFAGNCTHPGQHTGPRLTARFAFPTGITMTSDGLELYVADRQNNRILRIDLRTPEGYIHTVVDNNFDVEQQVVLPTALAMSSDSERLYITTENGVVALTNFTGGDDPIKTLVAAIVNDGLLDLVLANNEQFAITADNKGNRLLFVDLVNGGMGQFCSGGGVDPRDHTDGSSNTCEIYGPQGVAVIDDDHLFVTAYKTSLIRKISYQTQAFTTTTTEAPPSTESSSVPTSLPRITRVTRVRSRATKKYIITQKPSQSSTTAASASNPLALGLSAGLIIPLVLVAILVGFILYIRISQQRQLKEMYNRRTEQGGYSGPGCDPAYDTALQARGSASNAALPQYTSKEYLSPAQLHNQRLPYGASGYMPTNQGVPQRASRYISPSQRMPQGTSGYISTNQEPSHIASGHTPR